MPKIIKIGWVLTEIFEHDVITKYKANESQFHYNVLHIYYIKH